MSITTWIHEFNTGSASALPRNVFRYVLGTSGVHQLFLLALTASVALIEVVPLELQRRIVNSCAITSFERRIHCIHFQRSGLL
jgi:hypothetical protein